MNSFSTQITNDLDTHTKKKEGIFFTPSRLAEEIVEKIVNYHPNGSLKSILEPSCGSGEFICALRKNSHFTDFTITAIEKNNTIIEAIRHSETDSAAFQSVDLVHGDFLKQENRSYDIILGNPPYFVFPRKDVPTEYVPYMDGRPNIFTLFILKCIDCLSEDGVLAFVLPKSFLNCIYYQKIRQKITTSCHILEIMEPGKDIRFKETAQPTIVLFIRKKGKMSDTDIQNPWVLELGQGNIVFTTHRSTLESLLAHSTTLRAEGYQVCVGNIVWNQVKNKLTDDHTKTRLIYSGDVKDGVITCPEFKNKEKHHFINIDKSAYHNPVLVVNRGYGVGKYIFNHAIVPDTIQSYYVENHLIVIQKPEGTSQDYAKIQASFNDPRTRQFIELFFGNNAINTRELHDMLPIYLSPC